MKIPDNERLEVNDTMMDRYVEDANDKGDLSLNVTDVLYYVPKVRMSIKMNTFTLKQIMILKPSCEALKMIYLF